MCTAHCTTSSLQAHTAQQNAAKTSVRFDSFAFNNSSWNVHRANWNIYKSTTHRTHVTRQHCIPYVIWFSGQFSPHMRTIGGRKWSPQSICFMRSINWCCLPLSMLRCGSSRTNASFWSVGFVIVETERDAVIWFIRSIIWHKYWW